jgi:hypothetical protein
LPARVRVALWLQAPGPGYRAASSKATPVFPRGG